MTNNQHPAYAQVVDSLKNHSINIAKISQALDVDAFDQALHADWFMIDLHGKRVTKQQELDALRKAEFAPSSIDISDLHVEVHGDTAIVTGVSKVKAVFQGKDISGNYRFTQVYKAPDGHSLLDHATHAVHGKSALPTGFSMITCIAMATA